MSEAEAIAAVLAIVRTSVRQRFTLDLPAMASRIVSRASRLTPRPDPADYARRLSLDDLYLATACAEGDEQAWAEVRARYFSYIREFAHRFLHDRAAVDVADQVIADLWQRQRLAQYDGRSSLKTWLGAVVAHAAINAGKIERRRAPLDAASLAPRLRVAGAEDAETRQLFTGLVRSAIAALDSESRLLLLFYYEQALTLDEMQRLLGSSKATLSRRLDAVRRAVRASIETRACALGIDADHLRERLDFSRLEFDLASALKGPVKGRPDDAV